MTRCIHLKVPYFDAVVCVRGTSEKTYAHLAATAKGREAVEKNRTLSHQCYGTPMTVRPVSKCGNE